MRFVHSIFSRNILACGIVLGMAGTLGLVLRSLAAAETPAVSKSGSGTFVSFNDGTLTLRSRSGLIVYRNVGENYKAYHNNENGPGSRLVATVEALSGSKLPGNVPALSHVVPGTLVRVDVEAKQICFGLDHRVIGTLVSYDHGTLKLLAADAAPGFVKISTGNISLSIDPQIPALESINGGDLKFAGSAGEALQAADPGTLITARSEFDVDAIEVIEIGSPKRRMERYIGQTRGPVRGTLISFRDGLLRIHGKAINSLNANDYERLVVWRIADDIPIFESIDGGAYQPIGVDALRTAKEGTIITIRKVEDVILSVQIGVAK